MVKETEQQASESRETRGGPSAPRAQESSCHAARRAWWGLGLAVAGVLLALTLLGAEFYFDQVFYPLLSEERQQRPELAQTILIAVASVGCLFAGLFAVLLAASAARRDNPINRTVAIVALALAVPCLLWSLGYLILFNLSF